MELFWLESCWSARQPLLQVVSIFGNTGVVQIFHPLRRVLAPAIAILTTNTLQFRFTPALISRMVCWRAVRIIVLRWAIHSISRLIIVGHSLLSVCTTRPSLRKLNAAPFHVRIIVTEVEGYMWYLFDSALTKANETHFTLGVSALFRVPSRSCFPKTKWNCIHAHNRPRNVYLLRYQRKSEGRGTCPRCSSEGELPIQMGQERLKMAAGYQGIDSAFFQRRGMANHNAICRRWFDFNRFISHIPRQSSGGWKRHRESFN